MICTFYKDGEKLNVADLNEITVLIDRSQTELTEVAYNEWTPELIGPPHSHLQKEQVFFILSGQGQIKISGETFDVKKHDLLYVPSGAMHQTICTTSEPIGYFLFNSFANADKEGHTSFADHIDKVKQTRRKQADQQKADVEGAEDTSGKKGKYIGDIYSGKTYEFGSNSTILLIDRSESDRCEATVVSWPAGNKGAMVAHDDKEQTFFVLSGSGKITVGDETKQVKPGYTIFVPRNTPHTTEADADSELVYLCLNTVITKQKHDNFDDMYNDVAPARIERWKTGDDSVGL